MSTPAQARGLTRVLTRGAVGSAMVLVGGLVVSTLPRSTPLLRSDVLVAVRDAEAGRMAGLSVVLVGLGLLAASWLALCRHVALARGADRDDAVALVRFATVVWSAPLLVAPPLFSRDGWSYAAQGMLAHLGLSPYEHGPSVLRGPVMQAVDPMWLNTATPYGPLPLMYGDAVAGLTGNPWMLVIAHRALALVGLVLLAWAVPRLAGWTGADPALAAALVLPSPYVLANGVGGLHNDLLMVGLMAAALVVAAERGWAWGALLGGLAAAVKVPGGLVCLGVVLVTLPAAAGLVARLVRLAQVAALSLAALVGLGVVSGLGLGWVGGLAVPGAIRTPLSLTTQTGLLLDLLARWSGLGLPPDALLDLARQTGTAAAVVVACWVALWPTGRRDVAVLGVAAVVGVLVLLGPVAHLWYFLWFLPFVAVLRLSRAQTAGLLAASVVFALVAPLDSSLHGAYVAIALGSMLVGVLVPLLLLTPVARERIDRIARARPVPTSGAAP